MRKGEITRRGIIRKAAPIFNQKGYEGAALSELMEATGLEKGGIYRHFESKQQLAAEAFDYAWATAVSTRLEGTEQISNAVDRLKQIVWNFRDRREGLVPGGCPLLNTAIDTDDGNPVLRGKARRALARWMERLEAIVADECILASNTSSLSVTAMAAVCKRPGRVADVLRSHGVARVVVRDGDRERLQLRMIAGNYRKRRSWQ